MNTLKSIGAAIGVLALVVFGFFACVTDAVESRTDQCEKAWEDYVKGPPDMPQPAILTEDWCFNHLVEGE